MTIAHFRDLAIYRISADMRREIFKLSKAWPVSERYALTGQVRRSSRAICVNLAEAWAKRRFRRHFVAKLTDALGEAEETLVWIDVAFECGYMTEAQHGRLRIAGRQVCSDLVRMMRRPQQCGPASLIRDSSSQ